MKHRFCIKAALGLGALSLSLAALAPSLAQRYPGPIINPNLTPEATTYYQNISTLVSTKNLVDRGIEFHGAGIDQRATPPAIDQCHYGPTPQYNFDASKTIAFIKQPHQDWDSTVFENRPLWILSAHRGIHGKLYENEPPIPENSIQAVNEAAARLYEMVELDIHVDGNGQAVLFHDYAVGRVTNTAWDPTIDPPTNQGGPMATSSINGGGINGQRIDIDTQLNQVLQHNPLVNTVRDWSGYRLQGLDRDTGQFTTHNSEAERVTTLRAALAHVGRHYPGMVVVLDIRHFEEVTAAMAAVDAVEDCNGNPARNWVIFKPFGNVFPDGLLAKRPGALQSRTAGRWEDYYWIPVISGRLSKDLNKPGGESLYPNAPGPDVSLIHRDDRSYLDNWMHDASSSLPDNVLTYEVYTNPTTLLDHAANQYHKLNVTSWRPPDMRYMGANQTYTHNGQSLTFIQNANGEWERNKCLYNLYPAPTQPGQFTQFAIGYNFKDDALGRYPVPLTGYGCLQDVMKNSQILTIDHGDAVMHAFRGETRHKLLEQNGSVRHRQNWLINRLGPLLTPVQERPVMPASFAEFSERAQEGRQFTMPHDGAVFYGVHQFAMRYFTQGTRVNCNNLTFGDPHPGQVKSCRTLDTNWRTDYSPLTQRARENQSFTMPADGWVLYSVYGGVNVRFFNEGQRVNCNNATFGDPAYGVGKRCWVRNLTPPAGTQFCANHNQQCDPTRLNWTRENRGNSIEVLHGTGQTPFFYDGEFRQNSTFMCNATDLRYMHANAQGERCFVRLRDVWR